MLQLSALAWPAGAKAAPSKSTVFRHHYTPDAPSFRAALSQKDSLPVLRKTGSLSSSRQAAPRLHNHPCMEYQCSWQCRASASVRGTRALRSLLTAWGMGSACAGGECVKTPHIQCCPAVSCKLVCRRSSDAGQAIRPASAQLDRTPATIPEGAKLDNNHAMPTASTSASAAAAGAEPAPASEAALSRESFTSDAQSAAEPIKGVGPKPAQGLLASELVKGLPDHSSSDSAAKNSATPHAPLPKASVTPDTQSAGEPTKGVVTKPTQGLQASEPVKASLHESSSGSAAKTSATRSASGAALPKASVTSDMQSAVKPSKGVATKPPQGLQVQEPVKAARLPASGAALPEASITPDMQPAVEPTKGAVTKPTQGLQASEPVKALLQESSSDSAAKSLATPPASGAALPEGSVTPDVQPAVNPTTGVGTKPTQGLQGSEPVKGLAHESSNASAATRPARPNGQANGDAAKVEGVGEGAAAPPTPAKTTVNQPMQPEASHTPQEKADQDGKVGDLSFYCICTVCTAYVDIHY